MLEQWIIAMAVLLILFNPELTESSSNCCLDKGIEIKKVDENTTASVSCPKSKEDEILINISLQKGDTELHSTDMRNNTHQSWQQFQVSKQNFSFSYKILRAEANDTGLYSCEIQTDIRKPKPSQTILLVVKDAQQPTEQSCPTKWPLPLYISYGIIIFYNLIITVFCCYFARKLKTTEPPENPYINTRPGGFRRR